MEEILTMGRMWLLPDAARHISLNWSCYAAATFEKTQWGKLSSSYYIQSQAGLVVATGAVTGGQGQLCLSFVLTEMEISGQFVQEGR